MQSEELFHDQLLVTPTVDMLVSIEEVYHVPDELLVYGGDFFFGGMLLLRNWYRLRDVCMYVCMCV